MLKMARWVFVFAGPALWMMAAGWSVQAAEDGPNYKFVYFIEETVKADHHQDYSDSFRGLKPPLEKENFPFPYEVYWNMDTSKVITACPLVSMDDLEKMKEAWVKIFQNNLDQLIPPTVKWSNALSVSSAVISRLRPDLSYQPDDPVFSPDENESFFCRVIHVTAKPEKSKDFEDLIKKHVAFLKEKKTQMILRSGEDITGPDMPSFWFTEIAKTESDYKEQVQKREERLGEEGAKFLEQCLQLLKNYHIERYHYVPELSYKLKK